MKKAYQKILLIIAILLLGILLKTTSVKAANASISASTTSPTPGQTVTVTGSVTAGAWNLQLAGADKSETIYGYTNTAANASDSKSISFVAGEAGTTYKITLTGDMTDINASQAEIVNRDVTIVVANPPQTDENAGDAGNTGNTSQDTPSSSEDSSQGTTTNTPVETPKEETKSNNANLSNLGIRPNDFSGFKSGTTSYNVTVPNDVKQVELYATVQHDKATISGSGTKTLQEGNNALSVVVTAEDGTTKTYTVNVTREAAKEDDDENNENETEPEETEPENMTEIQDDSKGLLELKIENVTMTPEFETNVYEYEVKYIGEDTRLDITTKATDEGYVVDVTGNEDLKDGENIITILVSDEGGNNVATYQLTINKSLVDEEAILREQEEQRKQQEKIKKIVFGVIIAVAVVTIIIFFIIRNRRNNDFAGDYSGVPFSNLNDEDDWEENDNWQDAEFPEQEDEDFYEEVPRKRHRAKRFK